jgi:WhiB family redox-sensing transcriptional regulator
VSDEWREHAACKGLPTDWWFPERGDTAAAAKAICAACPVREPCLQYAVVHDVRVGVWGGEVMSSYHARRDDAIRQLRARAERGQTQHGPLAEGAAPECVRERSVLDDNASSIAAGLLASAPKNDRPA